MNMRATWNMIETLLTKMSDIKRYEGVITKRPWPSNATHLGWFADNGF